jgi:hypothetical protein
MISAIVPEQNKKMPRAGGAQYREGVNDLGGAAFSKPSVCSALDMEQIIVTVDSRDLSECGENWSESFMLKEHRAC